MKNKTLLGFLVGLFAASIAAAIPVKKVNFFWDANPEPGMKYKIYYGEQSRFDSEIDINTIYAATIIKFCGTGEPGSPIPIPSMTYEECKALIENYCPDNDDKLCHAIFFEYDNAIDVGSALGWNYTSTTDETLYFSVVADDPAGNESRFAESEIKINFDNTIPTGILNFSAIAEDNVSYTIEIQRNETFE